MSSTKSRPGSSTATSSSSAASLSSSPPNSTLHPPSAAAPDSSRAWRSSLDADADADTDDTDAHAAAGARRHELDPDNFRSAAPAAVASAPSILMPPSARAETKRRLGVQPHHGLADASNASDLSFDSSHSPAQSSRRHAALSPRPPLVDGSSPSSPAARVTNRYSAPENESDNTTVRENISPSLDAAFASPPYTAGLQTASTDSTESAATIRAALGFTIEQTAARTPSYPFPYVPATSLKRGSTPLHQPFTALSPTASSSDAHLSRAQENVHRLAGSRLSQVQLEATQEYDAGASQDHQSPTPNLYNLILQLNSELSLEAWWSCLIDIMRHSYKVDRMSLALPVDPTDVEGIPWGQKLCYNASGVKAHLSPTDTSSSTRSTTSRISQPPDHLPAARRAPARPPIESRHSYAGYESAKIAEAASLSKRPTSTTRPATSRRVTAQTPIWNHLSPVQHSAFDALSDQPTQPADYQSSESYVAPNNSREECYSMVYSDLQELDHEREPLLEPAGVNRVLERGGSLILLTRNFSKDGESGWTKYQPPLQKTDKDRSPLAFSQSRKSSVVGEQHPESKPLICYEDFEQMLASSWSHSPAPSPAIQNDPEENPFFASASVNEASFEPESPEADYSRYQNIEAIGIDSACSIIHIPLIHPSLSKMTTVGFRSPTAQLGREPDPMAQNPVSTKRTVPIAILSVSSSDAPYHSNLVESLRDLGPHLATSFNTCLHNNNIQDRIQKAIRSKHPSDPLLRLAPKGLGLGLDPEGGLESLLQLEQDDRSSTIESVASPSDRSGQSPMGSLAGTPGLEPTSQSSNSHSMPAESGGSYFDGYTKRSGGRASSGDHRSILQRVESSSLAGDLSPNKRSKEQKRTKTRDSSQAAPKRPNLKSRNQSTSQLELPEVRHSLLHSHGADFKASFQTLPAATIPKTPGPQQHIRGSSSSDGFAMPPPSERLLRIIIDGLPVQIFTAAPLTGRLTWVNSKLLQYRGLSAEAILNDPWGGIHPEDCEEYLQGWSLSLHTGNQFQQKVRLKRYDDTYRYFYVRATPLRTNEQRIVHWFGTMFDLHDQHIAEVNAARQQETAASEAKYRALANSSPQIVFAVNPKRGVSFCNSQWIAYSGQTEEEAKGTGFMDHVHPDDLDKCKLPSFEEDGSSTNNVPISIPQKPRRTHSGTSSTESSEVSGDTVTSPVVSTGIQMPQRKLSELATSGILRVSRDATGKPSYSTEVRLRSKSGEYRWHLVRVLLAEPLIQSEAQEETWYGTCTDINDHKELEQTLKETMDAKSRFLSNMSHEIRTPLNGIWGMTNFLIDSKLSGEQLDQVNVIRSSTEGLRDLINDILDLSKVEAGMITLNMDWLNVRSVIEEVNDLTSSLALEKGIDLNYLVDNAVPSLLKGDKFRFRQVLLNVIGNAIKFTEEGEVFIRCSVSSDLPENPQENSIMILIEVKDTGTGFSESEAERLFKRFSQIDGSSTRQHGGSGLGLVISMQLVELHGGIMTATSTVGKGSTFCFTLQFGLSVENEPPGLTPASESVPNPSVQTGEEGTQRPLVRNAAVSSDQPVYSSGITGSPSMLIPKSPSSAGSEPSARTAMTSIKSARSSQSSRTSIESTAMNLELRPDPQSRGRWGPRGSDTSATGGAVRANVSSQPRLYSILVVCPLPWMREATVGHLESVMLKNVVHTITARESPLEAQQLISGEDAVIFTHIVVAIQDTDTAIELINRVVRLSPVSTSLVIISDVKQKNNIAYRKSPHDFGQLAKDGRLQFVQKPLKPSKLAVIFDPARSAELSTDQNQSSAQQIAMTQKRLFNEMTRRLGDKDIRVLLVEDNPINQMVILKLLQRVSIGVETVLDGVQATEKVLSKPYGYYSIILMDIMMPNKDGYETCQDIRAWETENKYSPIPIVALSANVLDDVWRKCKDAGFNSYLTKPVEFKELSDVMFAFLDPEDPAKPIAFMQNKTGDGVKQSSH